MPELIEPGRAENASDFERTDAAGRKIRLSAYQGKVCVVLVLNRGFG